MFGRSNGSEEWLVRDQAGFARCLGLQPVELARQMTEHDLRTAARSPSSCPSTTCPAPTGRMCRTGRKSRCTCAATSAYGGTRRRRRFGSCISTAPAWRLRTARVALRWSLRGTHSGFGHFGPPSGAPVYVMGPSHAQIVDGRIAAEWLLTDEVAIWTQILAYQKT